MISHAIKFTTERLTVENWERLPANDPQRQGLVDELRPVLTPVVLHHLPEPLQLANEQDAIDHWLTARVAESTLLTIRQSTTLDLLGLLILAEFEQPTAKTTVHLGYLLSENAWRKGYATELLSGLTEWYVNNNSPIELLGGVARTNPASARVLLKNGFERVDALSDASTDMFRRII